MKFLITVILLFTSLVSAQQYVQKQDTQIINILTNAGFESGKTGWIQTTPANVTVVSGTDALFGAASVKFEATSGTEIFRSPLQTIPSGLKGKECHAVVNYSTNDVDTTPYVATVMDASGTVLATKDLEAKVVLGVPTDLPTSVTIDGWECPTDKQIQLRVENSALGDWVKLDNMHLGSKTGGLGNAADIANALGYTPADDADLDSLTLSVQGLEDDIDAVSASVSTLDTATLKKADNLSDVASATTARSNLGLGSVATESVVPVTKGGTGLTSVGASGTLLTSDAGGTPAWLQPSQDKAGQNYLVNGSFEQGTQQWITSGTVNISTSDRSFNGVAYARDDQRYLIIDSASSNEGSCTSIEIPQNRQNATLETSFQYRNGFDVSGTWVVTQTNGSRSVSSTINLAAGSAGLDIYSDAYSDFKMFNSVTSGTVTTCILNQSGTAIFHADNVYIGSLRSARTAAIVGPWQDYTPTFAALGTVTAIKFKWRQVGSSIEVIGTATAGTVTGSAATFTLPNNFTSTLDTPTAVGIYGTQSTAGSQYPLVYNNANNTLFFGSSNWQFQQTGTNIGTSSFITVHFTLPILGLQASGVSFDGRCQTDIQCTNEFTFESSLAGVTSFITPAGWSASCSYSAPDYTCTTTGLGLTVLPKIEIQGTTSGGAGVDCTVKSTTLTGFVFYCYTASGSTTNAITFITITKRGADFVAKKDITGYIGSTPTVQRFTSGSGTYITPAGARYIVVEMVGGGGGGGGTGSSSSGGTGGTGGTTTFGTSLLTANGGVGGDDGVVYGGIGGTVTINSPAIELRSKKGMFGGARKTKTSTTDDMAGGQGGDSSYGMGGSEEGGTNSGWSGAGYGAGGGGGGSGNGNAATSAAPGGGAGGELRALINNPSSTYSYSIGAAGAAGTAGTSGVNGGAGSGGIIIVTEYY